MIGGNLRGIVVEGDLENLSGDGPIPARVRVGTSGFHYKDWVGPVYPPGTSPKDYLSLYSQRFDTVEINYTYYRLPGESTIRQLIEKGRPDLKYALKLTQMFTHGRQGVTQDAHEYLKATEPLRSKDMLGALLAQFPYSFKPGRQSRDYLLRLKRLFPVDPLIIEVRNRLWLNESFFDFLRDNGLGFCCVDEPELSGLLPPYAVVTGPVGYVRFHGRNAEKWWEHVVPEERYDYRYSREELAPWVPRIEAIRKHSKETFVFFNNHFEGKAVDNALLLREMLGA